MTFRAMGPNGVAGEHYATPDSVSANTSNGAIVQTGESNHVALQGSGWLTVEAPDGPRLTRDGRMEVNDEGWLVHAGSGLPILGQGGMISVPENERLRIDEHGQISTERSGILDQLRLSNAAVVAEGSNLWRPVGDLTDAAPKIMQGALEKSNVDPMKSMVELIEASRTFEAFQKAMQASDEADARLNRLGGG
jgi:flagellar basal-body rod protein FlgF